MKKVDKEARKMILVAREGVLSELLDGSLLDQGEFPTEGHKKVIQLLHKETLEEMHQLGLTPYEF